MDGDLDVITSRAQKGIFSEAAELVWLKNNGSKTPFPNWDEQVLINGPDISFSLINDTFNQTYIIAAQFFSSQLTLYW